MKTAVAGKKGGIGAGLLIIALFALGGLGLKKPPPEPAPPAPEPAPPPEPEPPEPAPPALAEFHVPAGMKKKVSWAGVGNYWKCEVWCPITNKGIAPGTRTVHIWDSVGNFDFTKDITLQPGETWTFYSWQWLFVTSGYTVELEGDWEGNNYSKGVF